MTISHYAFEDAGPRVPDFDGEPVIQGLESHLYIVEFDDESVKVGITGAPKRRLGQHQANALNFGRRALRGVLTGPHLEARQNEQTLLRACREAMGIPAASQGEYFPLPLARVLPWLEALPQSRGDRAAHEAHCDGVSRGFIQALRAVSPTIPAIFPWAEHLDPADLAAFFQEIRLAMEEHRPLEAIDIVSAEWSLKVQVDQVLDRS